MEIVTLLVENNELSHMNFEVTASNKRLNRLTCEQKKIVNQNEHVCEIKRRGIFSFIFQGPCSAS